MKVQGGSRNLFIFLIMKAIKLMWAKKVEKRRKSSHDVGSNRSREKAGYLSLNPFKGVGNCVDTSGDGGCCC